MTTARYNPPLNSVQARLDRASRAYERQYAEYLLRREWYNMTLGNSVLFPGWQDQRSHRRTDKAWQEYDGLFDLLVNGTDRAWSEFLYVLTGKDTP